jgi:hypothetical protein
VCTTAGPACGPVLILAAASEHGTMAKNTIR